MGSALHVYSSQKAKELGANEVEVPKIVDL